MTRAQMRSELFGYELRGSKVPSARGLCIIFESSKCHFSWSGNVSVPYGCMECTKTDIYGGKAFVLSVKYSETFGNPSSFNTAKPCAD
jgi:hypothetical protein